MLGHLPIWPRDGAEFSQITGNVVLPRTKPGQCLLFLETACVHVVFVDRASCGILL